MITESHINAFDIINDPRKALGFYVFTFQKLDETTAEFNNRHLRNIEKAKELKKKSPNFTTRA